jgi:hypothetical protein
MLMSRLSRVPLRLQVPSMFSSRTLTRATGLVLAVHPVEPVDDGAVGTDGDHRSLAAAGLQDERGAGR